MFLLGILIGVVVGYFFASLIFLKKEWIVLKWSTDVMGFRPVMLNEKIQDSMTYLLAQEVKGEDVKVFLKQENDS